MTNATLFPRASFLGFDHLLEELDRATRHATDHYPPHNILKTSDTNYLIELAVAGFKMDELVIEVKDHTITITGDHKAREIEYIHRGISTKKFKRTFRLSEHVEVIGASFEDGILSIKLKYEIPQQLLPRVIPIGTNEVKYDTHSYSKTKLLNE